jgi:hypothetical protein
VRVVLGLVVVAIGIMWVYVLFIAGDSSPDRLKDRSWPTAAEVICASYKAKIDALPGARSFKDVKPVAEALRQRAAVGEQANAYVDQQLVELKALAAPTDANGVIAVTGYLGDWDNYAKDRARQIGLWLEGKSPAFSETQIKDGRPVSNRMDAFAMLNEMRSCAVPKDIG